MGISLPWWSLAICLSSFALSLPSNAQHHWTGDTELFQHISRTAGQCVSSPDHIRKDYAARRRQGLFLKASLVRKKKAPLLRRYHELARLRRTSETHIDAELELLGSMLKGLEAEEMHWQDKSVNGYQIYFKDPWERKTGLPLGSRVNGFKIRGGQPLLNYDIMVVDALARTLVNEAGLCEEAAESRLRLGPEYCRQKCGTQNKCTEVCEAREKDLGESQVGLHYGMVISSIFDRKIVIERGATSKIREAFGRAHRPELRTAYWEQALSRTLQYSLWNTPDYPNIKRINPTLFNAACPPIQKNAGLSLSPGDQGTEYQWSLALRIAFDHYKLSTPEALELRQCRATFGREDSTRCLLPLRRQGHEFLGTGPFQPWLTASDAPTGPFLFYTHVVAFPRPMREAHRVFLGSREVKPLRILYRTLDRSGRPVIREGARCQPRLWHNPILEPYLADHPR